MESLELYELLRMESILGLVAESSGIFSYIFVHGIIESGGKKKKKGGDPSFSLWILPVKGTTKWI